MKEKTSWDDIPSLDGVGVEWEYQPETALGKRAFVRINTEDLTGMFAVREIFVKFATAQQTYTGRLLDISKGGLSISLPVALAENLPVKVGLFLGTVKVISKAVIRHTRKEGAMYTMGVEFIDLDKESAEYIGGLYASKILNHTK
jgi:c-di-GMP-binding flagellar brake protein YcgR